MERRIERVNADIYLEGDIPDWVILDPKEKVAGKPWEGRVFEALEKGRRLTSLVEFSTDIIYLPRHISSDYPQTKSLFESTNC
jgi:hypothetical protein